MVKKLLLFFLLFLLLINSSFSVLYYKSYNEKYFYKYDGVDSKKFSYNYREANKNTKDYEIEVRENYRGSATAFNYYNDYRSGFKIGFGYSNPKTKVYNSAIHGNVNMWRRD